MADRHVIANARRIGRPLDVDNGAVLDIAPSPDANRVHVAANDDVHPAATVSANLNIPNHLRAVVDVGRFSDDGQSVTKRAEHRGRSYGTTDGNARVGTS